MNLIQIGRKTSFAATSLGALFLVLQSGCQLESDGGQPNPTTHGELHKEGDSAAQHTVSVKVNTMTCVAGCFNGIQTVLKKRPGIKDVKLAEQANDEGNVDNSVILVTYQGELDRAEVERTIVGAGFESIEFLDADAPATDAVN